MDSKNILNIKADTEFLRIVEGMVKYTQPMCPEEGERVGRCDPMSCLMVWGEERLRALLMHICNIEPQFYYLLKRAVLAYEMWNTCEGGQES